MSIKIGSRVRVRDSQFDPASGMTGIVDEVDDSSVPYHVQFDTLRNGVDSKWLEESVLVEIPVIPIAWGFDGGIDGSQEPDEY